MSLTITGKLIKTLEIESGTSKAGKEWKKQSFVIDTGSQYSSEVCFSLFGDDKIALLEGLQPGVEIEVSFNVSSREYNGKYYHNIDAWRINKSVSEVVENIPQVPLDSLKAEEDDDLPF